MSKAAAVTTAEFDTVVLKSEVPVLVDFWAAWCPPCLRIAPAIDAVAEELGERAKVVKVDVESEVELTARYGIQHIPTLYIFKGGRVVDQITGEQPRPVIASRLSAHV